MPTVAEGARQGISGARCPPSAGVWAGDGAVPRAAAALPWTPSPFSSQCGSPPPAAEEPPARKSFGAPPQRAPCTAASSLTSAPSTAQLASVSRLAESEHARAGRRRLRRKSWDRSARAGGDSSLSSDSERLSAPGGDELLAWERPSSDLDELAELQQHHGRRPHRSSCPRSSTDNAWQRANTEQSRTAPQTPCTPAVPVLPRPLPPPGAYSGAAQRCGVLTPGYVPAPTGPFGGGVNAPVLPPPCYVAASGALFRFGGRDPRALALDAEEYRLACGSVNSKRLSLAHFELGQCEAERADHSEPDSDLHEHARLCSPTAVSAPAPATTDAVAVLATTALNPALAALPAAVASAVDRPAALACIGAAALLWAHGIARLGLCRKALGWGTYADVAAVVFGPVAATAVDALLGMSQVLRTALLIAIGAAALQHAAVSSGFVPPAAAPLSAAAAAAALLPFAVHQLWLHVPLAAVRRPSGLARAALAGDVLLVLAVALCSHAARQAPAPAPCVVGPSRTPLWEGVFACAAAALAAWDPGGVALPLAAATGSARAVVSATRLAAVFACAAAVTVAMAASHWCEWGPMHAASAAPSQGALPLVLLAGACVLGSTRSVLPAQLAGQSAFAGVGRSGPAFLRRLPHCWPTAAKHLARALVLLAATAAAAAAPAAGAPPLSGPLALAVAAGGLCHAPLVLIVPPMCHIAMVRGDGLPARVLDCLTVAAGCGVAAASAAALALPLLLGRDGPHAGSV
eukprot:TRINITY_DN2938_c0_g1_i1.p1 TRINITY_DN2938_c0_g1~~TRINITY_DN2938_c0_g1_i1.p1  ORF type:complete len:771 (+),score=209.86 TRINITY_DN2938_c0_g1_i1:73-2313(+)